MNDTHAFSAHTFATFRAGFIRLRDSGQPFSLGYNPAGLASPPPSPMPSPCRLFPSVTVNNYTITNVGFGTGSIGPVVGALLNNISNGYTAQSDVTHVRGSHVFKVGFEYRLPAARIPARLPRVQVHPRLHAGAGPHRAVRRRAMPSRPSCWERRPAETCDEAHAGHTDLLFRRVPAGRLQDYFAADPEPGLRYESENLRTDRYNRLNFLDLTTARAR